MMDAGRGPFWTIGTMVVTAALMAGPAVGCAGQQKSAKATKADAGSAGDTRPVQEAPERGDDAEAGEDSKVGAGDASASGDTEAESVDASQSGEADGARGHNFTPADEKRAIVATLERNIQATESEDIDAAIAEVHPNSPGRAKTLRQMKSIAKTYELDYELVETEVLRHNETEAKVRFVQVTTKKSGPSFRDNRLRGIHTLRKTDEGEWKIWSTEILDITWLDGASQNASSN